VIDRTWIDMGMPITVCIVDQSAREQDIDAVADLFTSIDLRFSPYRETSEVSLLNAGSIGRDDVSEEFAGILRRCEATTRETDGFFNITRDGKIDPSGLVKGWAIQSASELLMSRGVRNFVVDAGGDVQACGLNGNGRPWRIGIRNPFQREEVVKVLHVSDHGVATSGTAIRGSHIYDPHHPGPLKTDIVSLTVIGPSIYDADRFATAAFAMGDAGLGFIALQPDLEGYAISSTGIATYTKGFSRHVG
jgi:thiamine biosynthesis lipoprotein